MTDCKHEYEYRYEGYVFAGFFIKNSKLYFHDGNVRHCIDDLKEFYCPLCGEKFKRTKVKAYVLFKKHLTEPDYRGDTYTQQGYDSVKGQLQSMKLKGQPVSDNFDHTKPPMGKIVEVEEDDKGILVTIELYKDIKPKGLGFGSLLDGFPGQTIEGLKLYDFSVTKFPEPGCEILEEE